VASPSAAGGWQSGINDPSTVGSKVINLCTLDIGLALVHPKHPSSIFSSPPEFDVHLFLSAREQYSRTPRTCSHKNEEGKIIIRHCMVIEIIVILRPVLCPPTHLQAFVRIIIVWGRFAAITIWFGLTLCLQEVLIFGISFIITWQPVKVGGVLL